MCLQWQCRGSEKKIYTSSTPSVTPFPISINCIYIGSKRRKKTRMLCVSFGGITMLCNFIYLPVVPLSLSLSSSLFVFFCITPLIQRPLRFCCYLPFLILYLNLHKFVYILSFVSFHRARELSFRFALILLDFFSPRFFSLILLSVRACGINDWCGCGCVYRCVRQIFHLIFVFAFYFRKSELSYIFTSSQFNRHEFEW